MMWIITPDLHNLEKSYILARQCAYPCDDPGGFDAGIQAWRLIVYPESGGCKWFVQSKGGIVVNCTDKIKSDIAINCMNIYMKLILLSKSCSQGRSGARLWKEGYKSAPRQPSWTKTIV